MVKALVAYRHGDTGHYIAAQTYSESKATVKRRTDGTNTNAAVHKKLFGRVADLLEGTENDLVNNTLQVGERIFWIEEKIFHATGTRNSYSWGSVVLLTNFMFLVTNFIFCLHVK